MLIQLRLFEKKINMAVTNDFIQACQKTTYTWYISECGRDNLYSLLENKMENLKKLHALG